MPEPPEDPVPAGRVSYEDARTQLREVVTTLESGGQSLEESLALWERGEALADICRTWLSGAATRLDEAIAEHDRETSGPGAADDADRDGDGAPRGQ